MSTKRTRLMTITLEKGIELYLTTMETEGKSPRYTDWLRDRLRYFSDFIRQTQGEDFKLQDLTVEHGREYIREMMGRDVKYRHYPFTKARAGKLAIQYIHGCGRRAPFKI